MELKHCDSVYFDEVSHSYWEGDKELIGVTSLMKKHGLSPKEYDNIPEKTLRAAADRGTKVHKDLEAYDNGESVLPSEHLRAYKKLGLRIAASEFLVSDNEIVASSIDKVICTENDDEFILGDIKTTSSLHEREWSWQLSIYATLFERQCPGTKVVGLEVIHIKKGKAFIIPIKRIPEAEVDALIDAERSGLPFSDTQATAGIGVVLDESEVSEYLSIAEQMEALKATEAALSAKRKEIEGKVLGYMTENGIETLESEGGTFKVKRAYTRTSIDSAGLKRDLPDIAERYTKTSEVAASLTYTAK